MEEKNKHILQQEIGKLGKKGLQRVVAIEKMVKALKEEYDRLSEEIKLMRGELDLLNK